MIPRDYFFQNSITIDKFDISFPEYFPQISHDSTADNIYQPEDIARSIAGFFTSGRYKIFFHNYSEGFQINKLKYYDQVANILSRKYNIPNSFLFFTSGVLPVRQNFLNYQKIVQENNLVSLNLIISNTLEYMSFLYFKNFEIPFNANFDKKPKKFISMNAVPRAHRLYFTMLMIERGLIDQGHYSLQRCNDSSYSVNESNLRSYIPNYIDKEIHEKCVEIFVNNYHIFPMYLSRKTHTDYDWFKPEDVGLFNEARFNIIQETNFFDKQDGGECFNYADMQMISEKTFRSFGYSIPFVMLNRPFVLRELKNYGYQTFHPYINEAYDNIQNDKDRLLAVLDEVERLCKLSDSEWQDIYVNLLPRLKHNYDKFLSTERLLLMH